MKAKKGLLRVLASVMAICMVALSVGAVSVGEDEFVFEYGEKEIAVSGGVMNYQNAQTIASILNDEVIVTPYNILCIFGHSISQGTATETTHRYYATAPRCLRNTYRVDYCTRSGCGYTIYTLTGQGRIHCC